LDRIRPLAVRHLAAKHSVADPENRAAQGRRRLDWAEAEHGAIGIGVPGISASDISLGAIFDDEQVVLSGQINDRRHFDTATEQMGHEDRSRARRDRSLQIVERRLKAIGIDIDRHGHEPVVLDDTRHVRDRNGGHDDFAPRLKSKGT
jgi:hypothetical protein